MREASGFSQPLSLFPEPGGAQWLYLLERRAIMPVKWLMCAMCATLLFFRSGGYMPETAAFALLAGYFATNLVFSYLIYFDRVAPPQIRPVSLTSFGIDIVVMAGFILLTGGVYSDFYILFFLVILRGMGFFSTSRKNVIVNVIIGAIFIAAVVLAGFDARIPDMRSLYEKIVMIVGVVLFSWFLLSVQGQQSRYLLMANRRLESERIYVQNLLESMTDGVIAFDDELRLLTANSAAREILKLPEMGSPEEIKRRVPDAILRVCGKYLQGREETTNEALEVRLRDDTVKTLRLSARAFHAQPESPSGVVAIFEDISDLRRMEEQLWQSEKMASVGQLAAGVAHELGNPIGIIKSCADYLSSLLKKDTETGAAKDSIGEEIEVIASESARCQRILRELLTYSSREAVALEQVDIASVIERAQGLVRYRIPEDKVELRFEPPEKPVKALADSNLLTQALVNILLNAIQSIEEQGKVVVRCFENEEGQVTVEIQDTGRGIARENLERIFEPFFTTRDEGTGLGLAVTRRMIERMEGTIEASSELGRGSRFSIDLLTAKSKKSSKET